MLHYLYLLATGLPVPQVPEPLATQAVPAKPPEPPRKVEGFGRVTAIRELEPQATQNVMMSRKWLISLDEVETLDGPGIGKSMDVLLVRRPGTRLLEPTMDCIGKQAVFWTYWNGQNYEVPDEPYGLSPNRYSFYVWNQENTEEMRQIRRASRAFELRPRECRQKMIEIVNGDDAEFLKLTALETIWTCDMDDKALIAEDRAYYHSWRNNPALSWLVRLNADFFLEDISPKAYRPDPKRLEFLRQAAQVPALTPQLRQIIQKKIEGSNP